jgi:hypothetical protein
MVRIGDIVAVGGNTVQELHKQAPMLSSWRKASGLPSGSDLLGKADGCV